MLLLASLAMPLFAITGWLLYLDRRRKKRAMLKCAWCGAAEQRAGRWLVDRLCQPERFRRAVGLADRWAAAGRRPGRERAAAGQTHAPMLRQAHNALFVVSTFGDGEAPDSARGFERQLLGQALGLGHLRYAMLALGDRQYQHFCGFAQRVQAG